MIHVLSVNEDLEQIRASIARDKNRPCYVVTSSSVYSEPNCVYLKPKATSYEPMTSFEIFMSLWDGYNICTKREGDKRYFDLYPSNIVRIVYPLRSTEVPDLQSFKGYGLSGEMSAHTVYLSEQDVVPPELEPFVADYPYGHKRPRVKRKGLRFGMTFSIQKPNEKREQWHLGFKTDKLTALQPPGWYAGVPSSVAESYNRLVICDCDPGPCIVCHGAKGQRQHVGVIAHGPEAYMSNHICYGCASNAFSEILVLLASIKSVD